MSLRERKYLAWALFGLVAWGAFALAVVVLVAAWKAVAP